MHCIPCEYRIIEPEDGIICVALLLTTPEELLLGLATVVLATAFIGVINNKIIDQK